MKNKNSIIIVAAVILVYIISTGLSCAVFSGSSKTTTVLSPNVTPVPAKNGQAKFDDSLPKTESCPLNGAMYSKQQKEWWEKHRPLGVMIENHEEARPQSGLSNADVIYEAVAEGAITRFLAVFYCQDAGIIGPVRSARTYFIDFASEYGKSPLYAHVGGANTAGRANALGQLDDYGWKGYNDMNQIYDGDLGYPVFIRDYDRLGRTVDTEHTMYSTTDKLWKVAKEKRKLTNVDENGDAWDDTFVKYTFKDDGADKTSNQKIHLEMWKGFGQYTIDWAYDKATNVYKRNNGGKAHTDLDTKQQLSTKNLIVLVMQETHANDGYEGNAHLLYKTKGTGKAYIFIDGKEVEGTWRKDGRLARTLIFDKSGSPVKFNKGKIWFEILPTDGVIEVK